MARAQALDALRGGRPVSRHELRKLAWHWLRGDPGYIHEPAIALCIIAVLDREEAGEAWSKTVVTNWISGISVDGKGRVWAEA